MDLSLSDIETILDTLVFDGKIEQSIAGDHDTKIYRAVDSFANLSPLMTIPCGVCPVSIKLLLNYLFLENMQYFCIKVKQCYGSSEPSY